MIDVSAAVFIFIIALIGVILFLLGYRIGQKRGLDPMVPMNIPFRSRQDFVNRVARPMVEIEGRDEEKRLMRLYHKASPYFICVSMMMMDNAIMELKARVDYLESPW